MQSPVGVFKEFFPALPGKGRVMAERADESGSASHLLAISGCEFHTFPEPSDGSGYGLRIVQSPERIDAYIEAEGRHLPSDIIGKATAYYQDSVFV